MIVNYDDLELFLRDETKSVGDFDIFKEIFEEWIYDKCVENLKEGSVIFDIWANIGLFTTKYYNKNRKWVRHLFEPFSENIRILKKNILKNNLQNIYIYEHGVVWGTVFSKKPLYITDMNNWGHSLFTLNNTSKYEEVFFIGIDKIILDNDIKHIDFAKIDCEWSEFDILFNSEVFFKITDAFVLELHYFDNLLVELPSYDDVVKFLQGKWYKIDIMERKFYPWEWSFYILHAQKHG